MKLRSFFLIGFCLSLTTACTHNRERAQKEAKMEKEKAKEIITILYDKDGKRLGEVSFSGRDQGTLVNANLTGLGAYKTHGFHLHEKGECEGDFKSAGGHFNPGNHEHGAPGSDSHAGDLGNIKADSKGMAEFSYVSEQLKIDNSEYGVIGQSVIVHAGKDDLKSQPSGDAGARLACGVITL